MILFLFSENKADITSVHMVHMGLEEMKRAMVCLGESDRHDRAVLLGPNLELKNQLPGPPGQEVGPNVQQRDVTADISLLDRSLMRYLGPL